MKAILNQLIQHEQLTSEQARQVIINIADGKYNPSQITAFLTVFMMRSISLEELEGFRDSGETSTRTRATGRRRGRG